MLVYQIITVCTTPASFLFGNPDLTTTADGSCFRIWAVAGVPDVLAFVACVAFFARVGEGGETGCENLADFAALLFCCLIL